MVPQPIMETVLPFSRAIFHLLRALSPLTMVSFYLPHSGTFSIFFLRSVPIEHPMLSLISIPAAKYFPKYHAYSINTLHALESRPYNSADDDEACLCSCQTKSNPSREKGLGEGGAFLGKSVQVMWHNKVCGFSVGQWQQVLFHLLE